MRTLDRYLAGIFIKNFFLSLISISVLFFFQGLIGELVDRSFPPQQVLLDHLMSLPNVFVMMTPPATILSTVLTLSGLTRTNELIAAYSIGVGLRRIVYLILSLVFVICCTVLVIQDRLLPPVFKAQKTYEMREMRHRQDFYLDLNQDKIWYRSKNLIYNLQRFDPKKKTIHGMAVYTFDDGFNLVQVLDATQAEFGEHGWRLIDGTVTVFSKDDQFPLSQRFKTKEIQIPETPADFQEIDKEVDGLRLKELWQYIHRMKQAGADTKAYEVKFHSRISLSFIPLVMCILGVPFSLRGRRDEGAAKDLSLCLGVTFFYWLFYSIGLSLGTNGALPPWLAAWLPSLVFTGVAVSLLTKPKQ